MYRTIRTILQYDMHIVSYDSLAFTIHRYDMELFPHDTIRIV